MKRAGATRLPRCPRAKRCAGYRSAPAGDRRGWCALPRPGACLPRSGGASGRASIRPRRGGRKECLLPCLRVRSPRRRHCPACAEAMVLSAGGADRMVSVVGALVDDARVGIPGGRADADLGACRGRPRRACWFQPALRGAGPPNKASIACCWASPATGPAVPGDRRREVEVGRNDQRRVARDCEFVRAPRAGSSMRRSRWSKPQRPSRGRKGLYACSIVSLGSPLTILTSEERAQQQDHDARC